MLLRLEFGINLSPDDISHDWQHCSGPTGSLLWIRLLQMSEITGVKMKREKSAGSASNNYQTLRLACLEIVTLDRVSNSAALISGGSLGQCW